MIRYYPDKIERSMLMWERTHDRLTPLKPKFKVVCEQCFINELVEELKAGTDLKEAIMRAFERATDVSFKHRTVFSPSPGQYRIDMHFKCMRCDRVFVFGVHVDEDYAKEIGMGVLHV